MNIFALHTNPQIAATMHVNKHVVKMPLETAQLLCTAHHVLDGPDAISGLYKPTHKNHPCALWVRETLGNYIWTYELFRELAYEYAYRYNKHHLSWLKMRDILSHPPYNIPLGSRTPFAQAMPDIYLGTDAIDAYRRYYARGKQHLHEWSGRPVPNFILELDHETDSNRSSVSTSS